jgi:hypothetical protein
MLLLIRLLALLFAGGGGYYGYSRWGTGGGLGILGTVLLVVVVWYLFGGMHFRGEHRSGAAGEGWAAERR